MIENEKKKIDLDQKRRYLKKKIFVQIISENMHQSLTFFGEKRSKNEICHLWQTL